MEPKRFEDRPAHKVVGLEYRIKIATADWQDLWSNKFMPRMEDINTAGEGHPCMGYYFGTDIPGTVDFLMGKPARDGAPVAEGLTVRNVPAAAYAVFECDLKSIGQQWGLIYGEWLPRSGWVIDEAAPGCEAFGPGTMEGDEPVLIYLPVKQP